MSSPMPLIAPMSFWEYSPEGFREYVRGLRESYLEFQAAKRLKQSEKSKKSPSSPVPGITYRVNDKGTAIITIRGRKPKWISPTEINALAKFYGVRQNIMWQIVRAKKIQVKTPDVQLGELG